MKDRDEILIWKYLDGRCDPTETAAVEKRLRNEEYFKSALEERKTLHQGLGSLEPEQPSMRFTANVMEHLPEMYKRLSVVPPLIRPLWRVIIVLTLGLLYLTLPNLVAPSQTGDSEGLGSLIQAEQIDALVQSIPMSYFALAASFGLGVIFLFLLDKRLKNRFEGDRLLNN